MATVAWVDFETGGLDAAKHDVTQIGCVLEVDGAVAQELNLRVRADPNRVEQTALDIQGRTMEEVTDTRLPDAITARAAFCGFLWPYINHQLWFAGQNPGFDYSFTKRLIGDLRAALCFGAGFIDLKTTAQRQLPGLENYKLGTICRKLGIVFKAHDALEDARAARMAYRQLVNGGSK